VNSLKKGTGGGSVVDLSRLPKGLVLGIGPDGSTVTLNIGKKQHVVLGLTFAVYDRGTTLIDKDITGGLRNGKAIVEVSKVSDTTSIARIVQLDRGATIGEGDVIANAAYDPNLVLRFYVYGDYDLDQTGITSLADKKRIENMITQWGGKLAANIDYDVDFLVLGVPPKTPENLSPEDRNDPVKVEENARQEQVWKEYQRLLGEATKYKITVLSQNKFLALTGFYQR